MRLSTRILSLAVSCNIHTRQVRSAHPPSRRAMYLERMLAVKQDASCLQRRVTALSSCSIVELRSLYRHLLLIATA